MKRNLSRHLLTFLSTAMLLISCSPAAESNSENVPSSSTPVQDDSSKKDDASSSSTKSDDPVTDEELKKYLEGLKEESKDKHLYVHYKKHDNVVSEYSDWDVWAWSYRPRSGEGARFDWSGRTQSSDKMSASGDATLDKFGGAYIDIDLTATYDGGWDNSSKKIGGYETKFSYDGELVTDIGIQIVQSSTRAGSSFWKNDGSNLYVSLEDYAFETASGGTAYHVFLVQDDVQSPSDEPIVSVVDPFADDDGTNVTYGDSGYNTADWTDKPLAKTSSKFLSGDSSSSYLTKGAGVGYQIMVSSFADSDGDGFGDIYGITQKLDYIKDLGINVIWLTPIQLSDSYHGYDISDYTQVDPKFGSSVSTSAKANGGTVSSATAMEDYKELLSTAHQKGMAVIMDLVLNHTSTSNKWFVDSAKLNEDYRGYYQWGNHETDAGEINEDKFWYPYGDHPYSYYAKFGSSMPELNYSYASTREAVASMAKTWASIGVDGFRMDAVKHIFLKDELDSTVSTSGDTIILDISKNSKGETLDYSSDLTKNINFWRELNYEVKKDYPDCFFIGENFDGHAYHVAPFYEGFDSLFDFYSYFNLTTAAAKGLGSSIGGNSVQAYIGTTAGSTYSASADNSSTSGLSGSTKSIKYGGSWDLNGILQTYEKYRSGKSTYSGGDFSFINGAFTSNHDIARPLNRIAGSGDSTGITAQGNVTSSTYDQYLKSATCMEIATLMLPGLSWIYYGDELGMTGNFTGDVKTSTDSYADLAYRQPMKWVDDGKVGDGSYTTGYGITGSGTSVMFDDVNSTSKVTSVAKKESSSHFKAIREFASIKSTSPELIKGGFYPYDWKVNNQPVDYVFNVGRGGTKDNPAYNVIINFSGSSTIQAGFDSSKVVATYNGASATSLPPLSALLIKNI